MKEFNQAKPHTAGDSDGKRPWAEGKGGEEPPASLPPTSKQMEELLSAHMHAFPEWGGVKLGIFLTTAGTAAVRGICHQITTPGAGEGPTILGSVLQTALNCSTCP